MVNYSGQELYHKNGYTTLKITIAIGSYFFQEFCYVPIASQFYIQRPL